MRTLVAMLAGLGAFLLATAAFFHTMCVINWMFNGMYGTETELAQRFFEGLSVVFGLVASVCTISEITMDE